MNDLCRVFFKYILESSRVLNCMMYRQASYIRRTLSGNKLVDHLDVVGASPVGYIFIHDLTPGFNV